MSNMIRRKFLKLLGFGVPLAPLVVCKVLADAAEPWVEPKNFTKMTTWNGNGDCRTWSDPKNWSNGVPSGGEVMIFPPDVNVGRLA